MSISANLGCAGELGEDLLDDAEPRRAELGLRAREEDLGHPAFADEVEERVTPEPPRKRARGGGRGGRHAGFLARRWGAVK